MTTMPGDAADTRRTVLVLDDDESLRRMIRRILELYEYEVLEAGDAHGALKTLDEHEGPVHLLLCDLILPGLGGREAANNMLSRRPEARVLYMSGYSSPDSFRDDLEGSGVAFLPKPFEVEDLIAAVEKVLS